MNRFKGFEESVLSVLLQLWKILRKLFGCCYKHLGGWIGVPCALIYLSCFIKLKKKERTKKYCENDIVLPPLFHRVLSQIRKKRPFIISRSTYPSLGKYGGHWMGDNYSKWPDMHYSITGECVKPLWKQDISFLVLYPVPPVIMF